MQNVDVNLNFDKLYFDTEMTLRDSLNSAISFNGCFKCEIFFINYVLLFCYKNRTYTDSE